MVLQIPILVLKDLLLVLLLLVLLLQLHLFLLLLFLVLLGFHVLLKVLVEVVGLHLWALKT